jgi:hypothetical protein
LIEVIRDSWQFYRRNIRSILQVFLPIFLLQLVVAELIELSPVYESSGALIWLSVVTAIFGHAIYSGALILLFGGIIKGDQLPAQTCIKKAISCLPLFIITDFMVTALIIPGLFLFIIPGVIIAIKLSLALFYLLLLNETPFRAILHSFESTKGFTHAMLGTMLVAGIPLLGLYTAIVYLQSSSGLLLILIDIAAGFYYIFLLIILFRFFCLINQREEENMGDMLVE